jgi:hypothetical protein
MADGPILALDLATTMGWAHGRARERYHHGSVRLGPPGSSHGRVGATLITFLTDFCKVNGRPDCIVYESPLNPFAMRGKTNFKTARVLLSMPFTVEAVAHLLSVDVQEVGVSTVRSHFVGGSIAKGDGKALVQRQCRLLGYDPQDDNAADAIAILDYALSIRHVANRKVAAL